jgi:hypothetical protein
MKWWVLISWEFQDQRNQVPLKNQVVIEEELTQEALILLLAPALLVQLAKQQVD